MLLVVILFILFLIMGMPVAFAIGISGAVFFLQQPTLSFTTPVQLVLSQTQNFSLLAIPMFIFAGNLLNQTGITSRLIKLSSVLAGHLRGGLAQTTCVLSALMGGVSGSVIADASMQARILGPDMIKRGFSKGYTAAIIGFSALIVAAIPPGIGLVLYGSIGEVSIGRLFAGGIVPGTLMTLALMTAVSLTARKKGYLPERESRAPLKEILTTFATSIWAFLFPIILIVGLRFGLLTPSEAGAFAAIYAIAVGLAAYRELTWKKFITALRFTIIDVGTIMYLLALSGIFSYGLVWENIPQTLSEFMLGISSNPYILLLLIIIFLLILSMFMDSTVIILMLTAILLPVVRQLGVDPVHFGLIFVMTLTIGLMTPPVGVAMYAICNVLDCSTEEFLKECVPFLLAVLAVILALVFIPDIGLFVPNLLFGK